MVSHCVWEILLSPVDIAQDLRALRPTSLYLPMCPLMLQVSATFHEGYVESETLGVRRGFGDCLASLLVSAYG